MKVYAVQHDIVWENKAANFARVSSMLDAVRPEPGSLIVLAEMFATGFSMDLSVTKEALAGETESFLRALAVKHECAVVGGLVGCGDNGQGRNEALAFGPKGDQLARDTKMRPFALGGESEVHQPGTCVTTFEFGGFKIAPLICYDLRFPELSRGALTLGADVLLYIASWPIKRAQHWVTLLQARAIENLSWVVGVNRCGNDPSFTYPGRSMVVDPQGVIIADAADREGVLVAELNANVSAKWREEFPAARDYLGT
jgi:predicted amidohydrolase